MNQEKTSRPTEGPGTDRQPIGSNGVAFVGIGASAGALEALERFFSAVPADSGSVFVVVQHLERYHPSVLAELLGKYTRMPVDQATDGIRARANHVYIIPPNAVLTLERGLLRVARTTEAGVRTPIDAFFRSLAHDQGENAVGIVLSGAGSDGTAGLRAVKENGGLTLAQTPGSAKFDSMPQSAIAAGLVDFTLPVEQMPARLRTYAAHLAEIRREGAEKLEAQVTSNLAAICEVLQRHTGHDFSRYKQGTLVRRIRRRLQIQQVASVADYLRILAQEPREAESLHRDLLIGVTHFFRDTEVWEELAAQALPAILESGAPSGSVRIWVPGCASGEEAYSIAILACEHIARSGRVRSVQIFATDIDDEHLATARRGRYSERISENVSPERLERFFTRDGDSYQVVKDLRAMCTFSAHSLIKDPPFSSLDLISCRNVLIYLGADLQKKLVPLFHFALRPGGYLLLGPSESLAAHSELFATQGGKHRLFRRSETMVRPAVEFPLAGRVAPRAVQPLPQGPGPHPAAEASSRQMFSQAFERMVLEEYSSPCAVINERGDILYVAGQVGRYLRVPVGAPTNNALDLAQGSLRVEMRAALTRAAATHRKVIRDNVSIELDGRVHRLRLTVRPLPGVAQEVRLFALVLQGVGSAEELEAAEEAAAAAPEQPVVEQLENELRTTRADLQSAMEELEASNEELKSSNEELISTNEELQSTNEELQSTNEELQTSKEELQSTNDELNSKVQELDTAISDLQHHYASTQIATIFLDHDRRIIKVTPAATRLFNVLESDAGRPIRDLALRFVEEDLLTSIDTVLATETAVERHVRRADGSAWYLVRIQPYRTQEQAVAGVGLTFVDITDLERSVEAERRYGRLLLLSPDAIFVWRLGGAIETWNRGAEALYGFTLEEARGQVPHQLLQTALPNPAAEFEVALRERGRWEGELRHHTKTGRLVTVSARLLLMRGEDGVERVLEANRDVTELRKAQDSLRESEERLRLAQRSSGTGVWDWFPKTGIEVFSPEMNAMYGLPPGTVRTYQDWRQRVHPDDIGRVESGRDEAIAKREAFALEFRILHSSGEIRWFAARGQAFFDEAGAVDHVLGTNIDFTERKRAEETAARSQRTFSELVERAPFGIYIVDSQFRVALMNAGSQTGAFRNVRPVIGRDFSEVMRILWPEPVASEIIAAFRRTLETGEPYHPPPFVNPRHDIAAVEAYEWELHRLELPGGQYGVICYYFDSTKLREAEAALRTANERLAEADRRRTEFLAVLSHELRNPLAPIRNSLFILDRAAPGGDQPRRAKTVIDRQVSQLARLVDDLLDVTRITRGKVQLQRHRLELTDLVQRTIEDHGSLFERSEVRLEVEAAEEPIFVNADWNRLAQVIGNLLSNSAKFTPHGGRVTVSLAAEPATGQAMIRVADTGAGMAPEMVEHLFQPFMQADKTLDRSKGGLGLGLALVKGLIEIHGGTVSGSSEGVGKGSVFTLRLPLDVSPGDEVSAPKVVEGNPARRVLVIEDNVDSANSLREALELGEHVAEVAYNGLEGLTKARTFKPDILLCDIGLPGIDGYEVARAFRADVALREVHLVALTGYAQPEDIAKAQEAGFEAHLSKPPSMDAIERVLGEAGRRR